MVKLILEPRPDLLLLGILFHKRQGRHNWPPIIYGILWIWAQNFYLNEKQIVITGTICATFVQFQIIIQYILVSMSGRISGKVSLQLLSCLLEWGTIVYRKEISNKEMFDWFIWLSKSSCKKMMPSAVFVLLFSALLSRDLSATCTSVNQSAQLVRNR